MKITPGIVGTVAGCGMFCAVMAIFLAFNGAGLTGIPVALYSMLVALVSVQLGRLHMRQLRANMSPEARAFLDQYMKEARYREKDRKS